MVKKILLVIPLILFLFIEWLLDIVRKITEVVHIAFRDVAVAIDKEYGNINKQSEPDSGQV